MNGGAAGLGSVSATSSRGGRRRLARLVHHRRGDRGRGICGAQGLRGWRYVQRRPIVATTPLPFGLILAPAIWAGWLTQLELECYDFPLVPTIGQSKPR